jgi:hypothetical protein
LERFSARVTTFLHDNEWQRHFLPIHAVSENSG